MSSKNTRLRVKINDDAVRATCLIKHPMETGNRKGADGELIPIHYIKYVRFLVNGELAATTNLGPGVSADPLISVDITGVQPGDVLSVEWEDNLGETDSAEVTV